MIPRTQAQADRIIGGLSDVRDHTLFSACRNVHEAKRDVLNAIEKATSAKEAKAIMQVCEEFVIAFDLLSSRAGKRMEEL